MPILGWMPLNDAKDPITFANVVAKHLRPQGAVNANHIACEAWLESLARHLLSEHIPSDWDKDFIITRSYTSLKYNPDTDPEPMTPELSVSIHIRMRNKTTHHLNVKIHPLPSRVLVHALQEERGSVEMWGRKTVQYAWIWEMWSVMDSEALEAKDLSDLVNLYVRADGVHVVERYFQSFLCPGMPVE